MESCLIDYGQNRLVEFSINHNKELIYKQFDSNNNTWSEQKKVDHNVLEFKTNVDSVGNIRLVYLDNRGLKYGIFLKGDFKTTTLFSYNNKYYKMTDIKFIATREREDITAVLHDSSAKNKKTLVHYERAMKKGSKSQMILDFDLDNNMNFYYDIFYMDNTIKLFFSKGRGKENEVFISGYSNSWSEPQKIYSYKGKTKSFEVKKYNGGYLIVKALQEYSLSIVSKDFLDDKLEIKEKSRYSSIDKIDNLLIAIDRGKAWGFWQENGYIIGGNLFDEVIIPKNISIMEGTMEMEYIRHRDGHIESQSLFGIRELIKPFLVEEVFDEEEYLSKIQDEFYKNKEEIIDKLFKELKNREKNIFEMMKKGREIELLAREREASLRELNDRYMRMVNQNKSMTDRVQGVKSLRELLAQEKKDYESKVRDWTKKEELIQVKLKKVIEERNNLSSQKVELMEENKKLKESIDIKDMLLQDKKEVENLNRRLKDSIKDLERKLNEAEDNLVYEKELINREKEKYLKEIDGLNQLLSDRRQLEKLLNRVEPNKNIGFFKKMFSNKEREE